MKSYNTFLESKRQLGGEHGFAPLWTPDFLFDFQASLVEWNCLKGRSADFADCGLGKTIVQLEPITRGTKRLRAKPDPKMAAWSKAVLERDGHKCQWPVLFVGDGMPPACRTRDDRIDPHHLAERSLRPDLKYDVSNGLALCRTHHDWVPLNRAKAIEMGLLRTESYEAAQKRKAMLK